MQSRGLHEEAIEYLKAFLRDHPKHGLVAEGHYRLAQSYLEEESTDEAVANLRQAIERGGAKFSLRPESQYRLGNLLQGRGDHEAAMPVFVTLTSELAGDHYLAAAATYAKAEVFRDVGKDADAARAFDAAAGLAVGDQAGFLFPSRYQGGFAWLRLQDYEAALQDFDAARGCAPDDAAKAECRYLVGDAYLRLRQYKRAESAFRAAGKIAGEFSDDAQYGLGWSALGRKDNAAALVAFGELISQYPQSPFVNPSRLEQARLLYQAQRYDGALRALEPLLARENALQQEARELRGLCALASGAGESAVKSLKQAVAKAAEEDKPRLYFALGEAHANLGQWAAALEAYEAVPETADGELSGDALYGAAHALHELGRHEDSIRAAGGVLALEPPHRSRGLAQLAVAENLFALRQYKEAEAAYTRLVGLPEHRQAAQWKLAWCRYLQGDQADAAKQFGLIAKRQEVSHAEEACAMQALALYESGDQKGALAVADRYRARYKSGVFLARTERVAARVLRQQGDLGAAQRRLERAATIASQQGGVEAASVDIVEQADLAYQQGDFTAADGLFAEVVNKSGSIGARALAGRAWCAFELGDDARCKEALLAAKQHPEVGPEMPGLLELESALLHRQGQWPEAVQVARSYLQSYGDQQKASGMRYALGVALARSGQQGEARDVFSRLVVDGGYPDQGRVLYELAWACRRDGDDAAALESFRRVAALGKDPELVGEARLFVGTSLLQAKPPQLEQATEWLAKVTGRHQKQALYRLGFAEFEAAGSAAKVDSAMLGKARDRFAAIAALDGDELLGEALYLGAECCRRLGDYPGAVQRSKRLLEAMPQHDRSQRARLLMGECALLAKTPDEAVAPLVQFLAKHDPATDAVARADSARANLWLGDARMQRQEYVAAEACFGEAVKASDGSLAAQAQFRLGESRAMRQDLDGAIDALVKLPILYRDPVWVPRGLLKAGQLYLQLKQPEKANVLFEELLEKHKGSDEAKSAADLIKR